MDSAADKEFEALDKVASSVTKTFEECIVTPKICLGEFRIFWSDGSAHHLRCTADHLALQTALIDMSGLIYR